ncbi:DUF5687 family protein [Gaoshiqia sp. Z1-71]|uniref:DUF5687 family protein n=1 Tax=Gaoshiqia hydrogeniformans TaxID=3290090 RepID=UPI003BF908BD
MKLKLLYLTWKEITRSSAFGKSVATNIMLGFLALYFGLIFFALGLSLPQILKERYPDSDPVSVFNSLLLIYFAFDLLIRQLLQSLPTISFKPLIVLNIRRREISRYLLFRSAFHFFNFLPLFLLVPVCFTLAAPGHPGTNVLVWLTGLVLMIFTNHFLSLYLKWWINESSYGIYLFIAVFASLYGLNHFGLVDFSGTFGRFFDVVLEQPALAFLLIPAPTLFYWMNDRYLQRKLYLNLIENNQKTSVIRDFSWMNRFGDYGKFISLEVRMIWRNKRPRSQFVMTVIFLLYGLILYQDKGQGIPELMLIFGGLFMVSMFSLSIGQFFPAWHSNYFSMLMCQNFKMKQFLQSFYYINVVVSFIYYLLTLPYALLDTRVIYFHTAMLFYHIGVNMNIIFIFGKYSKRALDLSNSSVFNYQGMGASQWLISFPLIVGPILLFSLAKLATGSTGALLFLAGLGLAGIILQPQLFEYFTKAYRQRKYQLIKNYKNS